MLQVITACWLSSDGRSNRLLQRVEVLAVVHEEESRQDKRGFKTVQEVCAVVLFRNSTILLLACLTYGEASAGDITHACCRYRTPGLCNTTAANQKSLV
jgi:hypothetical protein